MIIRKCLVCKKSFKTRKWDRDLGKDKYCSKRCFGINKKGKPTWNKGKKTGLIPKTAFKKKDIRVTGKNAWNWKGGITPKNQAIRNCIEYKLWRDAVFKRDNYTCIWCGQTGGDLNADHIKPFAQYPELRFAIDNGRTLCVPCHKTTNNYGWKQDAREAVHGGEK